MNGQPARSWRISGGMVVVGLALVVRLMALMTWGNSDLRGTHETSLALEGIVSVDARPGVARLPGCRPGSFARGIDVALTFEPQAWTAGGLYLLAGVLERFLALQVSINGFVRTTVHLRGRSGSVASWPARSGTRVLL